MNNVTIKTTDWQMTDEISAYLDEKLSAVGKLLPDAEESAVRCDVELSKARDQHAQVWRAEMNLYVGGALHRSAATGETMQAAIDEAKDGLMQQLRKAKQKQSSMLRRGGARVKSWLRFGRP